MRNQHREKVAEMTSDWGIRRAFKLPKDHNIRIGLVLGTGWGDALEIRDAQEVSFKELPGFDFLGDLEGHARSVVYGKIANREVIALRGRVHVNEGHGESIINMVRLQTEMLFKTGVRTLIVTSAVGSLIPKLPVGSVAVVDSFISLFAGSMPGWVGEFRSPEDMLNERLNKLALRACSDANLTSRLATHAMVRGPFFEGRKTDKKILKRLGAHVVGMSMLPEACVASLYDVKVVGLGFVTNNDTEEHSHEENVRRAKESQEKLGALLTSLVYHIPPAATHV